ncbi:IPT/TIG domain-containing protein [Nocardia aurantiaca]|uniref:IPT/TIG domain-containing protein n=1 Tax=Nocardia aurantiaca TaxID=2675850 RepID=A0A6I3KX96_9NOCA|nr:IPT/TIG domain-containing protein [Nocardia aurantiaca]MTE12099.1 hypothetical protein [Nocardia aurantiaca]
MPTITSLSPTAGPTSGGNSVIITGTDFIGPASVSFGGYTTYATVNSPTQITATAPAGTGTVLVIVTTVNGPSNGVPYTYGAPALTSINPTSGPAAGGTQVTLTGTGFTATSTVKFGAATATIVSVTPTQIVVKAPPGTSGVQVTVTDTGGTSNGILYTYSPVPTLTGVNPPSGPAAGGTVVTLTGTGFIGVVGVYFDNLPATSFTVNSPTQITATTPATSLAPPIAVQVVVATGGGLATNVFQYT